MSPTLAYVFAPFSLQPDQRLLTAGDRSLKLGGRAFDTLVALVERRERAVSKHELLDIVWPGLVVEENNLQVQVATLRKLLGHHAIATIPGRGYRFTLPVQIEGAASVPAQAPVPAAPAEAPATAAPDSPSNGSAPPHRSDAMYGRQTDVAAILAMLRKGRIVTIAGAGGIGKTRVGEASAIAAGGQYADGVWWVELASTNDPALVATAVARALGLSLAGRQDTLQSIVARVGQRAMLLVLDNCEHLLDAVTTLVATLLSATPHLRVLITSQDVLRSPDEQVYRLGTLDLPGHVSVESVAGSSSGSLLCARISAVVPRFALTSDNAGAAAEICRRLDGIPLALELAAARVPLLGMEGVRTKLNERFRMLTAGTRAVLRAHQTLRAALEWSHALLSKEERIVFRRLGVFSGGFTLESAQRVAEDDDIDAWDVLEHLGGLVDKSLVLAEGDPAPRYRLFETTRLYALEQLADADETATATRKHAQAICSFLAAFDAPAKRWRTLPADWSAAAAELDNTRAALDWADSQPEATSLCLELATASLYAFTFAKVVGEGFRRILVLSRKSRESRADVPEEVEANFLLALARFGTQMANTDSLDAALRAQAMFSALEDDDHRYTALCCAVAIAARAETSLDVPALIEQAAALEQASWPPRMLALFQWARHRWLLRQGCPAQALHHALQQVVLTRASGVAPAAALLEASNVAYCELAMGCVDAAEERAHLALETAAHSDAGAGHALDTWMMCLAEQGRFDEALAVGRRAYADLHASGDEFMLLDGLAFIAASQGRYQDAVVAATRADAELADRRFVRWPLNLQWRQRTQQMLAAVPAEVVMRWQQEAVHMQPALAALRALGDSGRAEG